MSSLTDTFSAGKSLGKLLFRSLTYRISKLGILEVVVQKFIKPAPPSFSNGDAKEPTCCLLFAT